MTMTITYSASTPEEARDVLVTKMKQRAEMLLSNSKLNEGQRGQKTVAAAQAAAARELFMEAEWYSQIKFAPKEGW